MTINDLKNIVEFFMNKEAHGSMTPAEFNSALALATDEYVAEKLPDARGRALVYQRVQRVTDDLRPLRSKSVLIPDSFGKVSFPSDYLYGLYLALPTGPAERETRVEVVKDGAWPERSESSLIDTETYPIARFGSNDIQLSPRQDRVALYYLRKPTTPVWGFTLAAVSGSAYGRPQYDASTTVESDFQDSPTAMLSILHKVGQYFSLNITRQDVMGFNLAKEQI